MSRQTPDQFARRFNAANGGAKRMYTTHYVHKISNPNGPEQGDNVMLSADDTASRKSLGAALRKQGALLPNTRIHEMRVEAGRVLVFPTLPGLSTYHHCVILTPVAGDK